MDPRIYRIAPELRRSAIYAIVGFVIIAIVGYWVHHVVLQRESLSPASVVGVILPLAMIIPLRWALRVDHSGISRRWLIGWDHWSWDDFWSGRIEKRYPFTFFDADRSWCNRKLRLDYVTTEERKDLIQLINQHYQLPTAAPLPETLHIECGFRRRIELAHREICLTVCGKSSLLTWDDVQRVHITRADALRRDFTSLELALPGHEFEMKYVSHNGQSIPTWKGATAEELSEYLLTHAPAGRIAIDISGERPRNAVDVHNRLMFVKKVQRDSKKIVWAIGVVIAVFLTWIMFEKGVWATLAFAGMLGLYMPIIWFVERDVRKTITQLETWLAELQNEPNHVESVDH